MAKAIIDTKESVMKCCSEDLKAVRDALHALSGTWKLPILMSLSNGTKRFKEISKEVHGISVIKCFPKS